MSGIPSLSKLKDYEQKGLIRCGVHKALPLSIYTYTEFTAFERLWNSVTASCRGLVVDDTGKCIVRCIPKFFNEGEKDPVSDTVANFNKKVIYFDKLDGSLIQIVNDDTYGVVITSKGSFHSNQAQWAEQIVNECSYTFIPNLTYVFELIHPENRIVIDYKGEKKIVLIAVIVTETGLEKNIYSNQFNQFHRAPVVEDIMTHMESDVEGVVRKR